MNSVRTVVRQLRTLALGTCAAVAQSRVAQGLDLGILQILGEDQTFPVHVLSDLWGSLNTD